MLLLDPPLDTSAAVGWFVPATLDVVVGWADGRSWYCGICEEGSVDTNGYGDAMPIAIHPVGWMPLPKRPAKA